MFSAEQIEFMKQHGCTVDFSKPIADDDLLNIDDQFSELLMHQGFDKEYEPTAIGLMCESIMDTLAEM